MEVVEALARNRIPGQEMQLIWVLLRKTWGWNKKVDQTSLSQFSKLTGIDRSSCSHLINSLISKNIVKIGVDRKVNTLTRIYRFNKDYETWKTVDKKPTVVILPTGVDRKVNRSVDTSINHNRYLIDTIQYIMSQLLCDLIKSRRNNFKKPDLQAWSKHIDLMIRIDKRDPKEIRQVIKWCQADSFWCTNILSTKKLRGQFDQLTIKMGGQKPSGGGDQIYEQI